MRKRLRGMWFMVSMSFRASPWLTFGTFGLTALGSLLTPLTMYATKLLIDAMFARDASAVAQAIAVLAVVRVASQVALNHGMTTFRMNMEDRTRLYVDTLVLDLAQDIHGLEHFERRDFADEMDLLRSHSGSLAQTAGPLVFLLQVVLMGFGTLALLASIHPLLLLVPVFGVPGVIFGAWSARINQRAQEEVTERMRLGALMFQLATGPTPGKEVRIFGLAPELERRHARLQDEVLREMTTARRKGTMLTALGSLTFAIAYIAAIALVAARAVAGDATAGDVALALTATGTVSGLVSSAVTNANWLTGTLKTINRFIWLMDYADGARPRPDDPAAVPERVVHGIAVEGVSFTYPGTDALVLEGVDLFLPAGSTVALVGDNGVGKTTLVKLLCRFYEPTSGRITLDGVDIRRFDPAEWRARMSAAFQDFATFEFVARESVGVGNLTDVESAPSVLAALDRANASDVLMSMPQELDTQLGKSFDGGVDLSTGQWQKLALGRALMREDQLLLLLDEPTASLDAQTEHALFERYAKGAEAAASRSGAITVLVSHRFSTVRMADLILVVEGGRVSEVGSHDELMARGGTYAELFEIQASAYR